MKIQWNRKLPNSSGCLMHEVNIPTNTSSRGNVVSSSSRRDRSAFHSRNVTSSLLAIWHSVVHSVSSYQLPVIIPWVEFSYVIPGETSGHPLLTHTHTLLPCHSLALSLSWWLKWMYIRERTHMHDKSCYL